MPSLSVFRYCTSTLTTVLLLSLTTRALAVSIRIENRKPPLVNTVTLYCQNNTNQSIPGATYQRALGSDSGTPFTSFNYTTVSPGVIRFVISPMNEGFYRCSDGTELSDPIELVGEYVCLCV